LISQGRFFSRVLLPILSTFALAGLASCGGEAQLRPDDGTGPNPKLPEPRKQLIPLVEIAPATGWGSGEKPASAAGTAVAPFADKLDHPRWLYLLPNGDVLVAETNAPPRPENDKGIKAFFMKKAMAKVGAGTPSANRITLLRDTNGDGVADQRSVFLSGLNSPFGMTLVGNDFYVADTDALLRFPYMAGQTQITDAPSKVTDLPGGARNHHWTKNVIASKDGSKLYVTVGSNSNVAEHGMDQEEERAAIWEVDRKSGTHRVFASGLRNPNGMAWEPTSGALWTAVNERDEIGSDLVPDYITSVRDGGFYGWPYSYYGNHVDERVKPQNPDLVSKALKPDYAVGPHTASLGLAASRETKLPAPFENGMFIGQHGSWNRKPLSGYKVIFVPFSNGVPSGAPIDVLTGFVDEDGNAQGRPVGVAIDKQGGLLVADDVGNTIWRVTAAAGERQAAASEPNQD
jgi:glucose/arabinose dehydrogenase